MGNVLITAVEPQKKNKERYNIFVDGEYFASLGAESCAVYGVKSGETISEEKLAEAVKRDNERYAFDATAKYLEYGMRTKREVECRLADKNIGADAIAAAIEKLESYGYIDDFAYAREYVQSAMAQGKSRRAAEYALKEKGIERNAAAEAMSAYSCDDEMRIAKKLAQDLKRQKKDRRQAYAALARRGFDYDIISAVLSEDEP
ncbi:MAG: RecX family transcriptional regulator [Burkholderiales bacterium]